MRGKCAARAVTCFVACAPAGLGRARPKMALCAALHLRSAAPLQRSEQRDSRAVQRAMAFGAHARLRTRQTASLGARVAAGVRCRAAAAPREAPPEEDAGDEDDVWGTPMEELWSGWEDPSPENFFVVCLSLLLFGALALISFRILVVFCSILIAAAKYTVVALLLVLFGVLSSTLQQQR